MKDDLLKTNELSIDDLEEVGGGFGATNAVYKSKGKGKTCSKGRTADMKNGDKKKAIFSSKGTNDNGPKCVADEFLKA